jgi:hypothetical protein
MSTAVDAELWDVSLISSSMLSAHLAPFNSDFSPGTALCSFAGVMAPDGALLDCADAGFESFPRAACAYEKGIDGAAGFTASACDDDISKDWDRIV